MELSDRSASFSTLFCPEDGSYIAAGDEYDDQHELFIFCSESSPLQTEDEYIETLVSEERSLLGDDISASGTSLLCNRYEFVRWILKMKACFGFSSQTAYLAVTYIDRFFLRRTIDEGKTWAIKLLSISCLSLASKMEEYSPPLLSEYCFEGHRFSSQVTQRMELLVLVTLEWRLSSVTPFVYLRYFASKFNFEQRSKNLFSLAISFIFDILEAASLMNYRPSAIAAAAIFAASGDRLTNNLLESKINTVSLSESLDIGQVFTCYNAMIHKSKKENL
ncbi:Cyclin-D5-2 [Platanthera guangdongensis]|uniref:Cyclin-D5-2 n=1 Tax=Platanthera guangdongensis TaxID=2320717 RepID=A0ABR2MER9_9ASPA